ncbi:MAG: EfeM/EfeO family lipoprotein [Myxococcota bacterium]|nr:EfeM/EfeO family lipoprotein [Myxococcota bacterium]
MRLERIVALGVALAAVGCRAGDDAPRPAVPSEIVGGPAPETPDVRATRELKRYVDTHVAELASACVAICEAAPAADADGWSAAEDREDIDAMRAHWRRARAAYERIEGAIAILFPETDADVDGRYERVIELRADPAPFDPHGFVGMHAVERVLWSGEIPPAVDAFERALPFYAAPRAPHDELEARAFTSELCARLVSDVRGMERELGPIALDPATAWRGIHGSIEEQAEKVLLGSTGEDESRYAAHTLADMRANLQGGRAALRAFAPWIESLPEGRARLAAIEARMGTLERAYRDAGGDALPPVPEGFDPDAPSDAHLATPYGRLFAIVHEASDPRAPGSLAALLRETGDALGIPPLGR